MMHHIIGITSYVVVQFYPDNLTLILILILEWEVLLANTYPFRVGGDKLSPSSLIPLPSPKVPPTKKPFFHLPLPHPPNKQAPWGIIDSVSCVLW